MDASQNIVASIRIRHRGGEELAFLSEKEELRRLGLTPSQFADAPEYYLNTGEIISLKEKRFKIIHIYTKFYKELKLLTPSLQTSVYGKLLPYNFEITYLVEEV